MGRYLTQSAATSLRGPVGDVLATIVGGLLIAAAAAIACDARYGSTIGVLVVATALGSLPGVATGIAIMRRTPLTTTPADRLTLARAALACGCGSITVIVLAGHAPARTWLLFTVAVPTLLLDAVDGAVARRTGTVTESGGLLDMQVDAGVLVVLSLAVAARFGPWVVLIGVMRYALVVASWIWPTLSTALPRSRFRVVVAGLQGAVLAAAIAPLLPIGVCRVALVVALALLIASFVSQIAAIRGAHTSPSPRRSQIDRGWASKWIRVGRSRRP